MTPSAVLALDDPRSTDPAVVGAKAANLARCAPIGVAPVLPGFVVTTAGVERWPTDPAVGEEVRRSWAALGGETSTVVVRSSSTIEDAGTSSMAGQFTSVLDVHGWEALETAVEKVIRSADRFADDEGRPRPIAVLVQRQLDAALGGVLFSADPVSGDRTRVAVDVVPSRPDELVGGTVTASHYVLTRRGRVVERTGPTGPPLAVGLRRRLARLAIAAEAHFGTPQDIEWAVGADGRLWLLQARPITTLGVAAEGVILGPGPVAETFPEPLSSLEQDLFLPPLRDGIVGALTVTGAVTQRRLDRSPVLVAVGGRVAVDLELLGITRGHVSLWQRISPSALTKHVAVSWRVGRARVALPELARSVIDAVDDHLASIPVLSEVPTVELVDLVELARRELATVHRYEVLAGMLLPTETGPPAASVALRSLRRGRRDGLDDDALVAEHPVVLALRAPRVGAVAPLPAPDPADATLGDAAAADVDDLALREALRLRSRWLQELLARAAVQLGARLVPAADGVAHPVRFLTWAELQAIAGGATVPDDLAARAHVPPGPPLPTSFRRSGDDAVVAVRARRRHEVAGIAAGGGRAVGPARHRVAAGGERPGGVLVVRHLEPELAVLLPVIDGLVSETGSPLSHLAILAREMHVATVVGVPDALARFPPGVQLEVDGNTGDVVVRATEETT